MKRKHIIILTVSILVGLLLNSVGLWLFTYWLPFSKIIADGLFPAIGYLVMGIGIVYVFLDLTGPSFSKISEIRISPLQAELEQAIEQARSKPEKIKPAWDLARVRLELYFDRNLNQINYIFWLSALVMIVGFGFILFGISRAFTTPAAMVNTSNQLTPALIGGVAGVITEFIGATFLFVYRSTIQQAANYTRTLERINSVGMAMQILDTISSNATELQDQTKAEIVKTLLSYSVEKEHQNQKAG